MARPGRLLLLLAGFHLLLFVVAEPHPHGSHDHHDDNMASEPEVPLSPIASNNHAGHSHSHMHAGAPKTVLNETQIYLDKGPQPLSYVELDAGVGGELFQKYGSHYGTVVAHGFFMTLAFAVALPLLLMFKIAKHSVLAGLAQTIFLTSLALGVLTGITYAGSTPDLYRGQKHGTLGWLLFALAVALSSTQVLRAVVILFSPSQKEVTFLARIRHLLAPRTAHAANLSSYQLVDQQQGSYSDEVDLQHHEPRAIDNHAARVRYSGFSSRTSSSEATLQDERPSFRDSFDGPSRFTSGNISPPFEHGPQSNPGRAVGEPEEPFSGLGSQGSKADKIKSSLMYGETFLWRAMIPMAWAAFISGCVIYWGGCRSPYVNACLAHEIKGSIFFWYGILTFGRYCGAWAELGWAWNRKPNVIGTWREHMPSAEMVESFVIWLYGATNTFMERFGAAPGSPWTLHQVQHVSIAVMFFFAGSAGMLLESKACRRWVSTAILARADSEGTINQVQISPASFNVFPALTIGITGLAMSAHHQEYAFAVSIHALWGTLLAGFAVCRLLTYTFLHLRPPASVLPSRPPTEALAAFCLCAGGITFMLSTEEVVFWAMRHGFDDIMTVLNATVAFTCGVLAWVLVLMALKGWATQRSPTSSSRSAMARMNVHVSRKLQQIV